MVTATFISLAALVAVAYASPIARQDDPATVFFTPFAAPGCQMSENPHSDLKPTSYNVTTGSGCVTSSYAFLSYVEEANADAMGPCSLSLFSEPNCQGDVSAATRTSYTDCIAGDVNAQSFLLACGP